MQRNAALNLKNAVMFVTSDTPQYITIMPLYISNWLLLNKKLKLQRYK